MPEIIVRPSSPPPEQIIQTAIKAAFLNSGQNCAGGERFFVQRRVVEQFSDAVVKAVNSMRQGPPLGHGMMDNGAMTMPGGRGEGGWIKAVVSMLL